MLRLRVLLNGEVNARPSEVFQWITGQTCAPQQVLRTALWRLDGSLPSSPLDLGEAGSAGGCASEAREIGTAGGCR
jgi:hypothetical protein